MIVKIIIVFFVSMVPFIEIDGAVQIIGTCNLPEILSIIIAVVGNMLPMPLVYFLIRKFLDWGKDKNFIGNVFNQCYLKGERLGNKLVSFLGNWIYVIMAIFVGIPLPIIGAWIATIGASILHLGPKKSMFAVFIGIMISAIILCLKMFEVIF